MRTADEYSRLSIETRLDQLQQTPEELERAIAGKTDAELSRRPDAHNWAAKEIVCHLRDVEELFQIRFHTRGGARRTAHSRVGGERSGSGRVANRRGDRPSARSRAMGGGASVSPQRRR